MVHLSHNDIEIVLAEAACSLRFVFIEGYFGCELSRSNEIVKSCIGESVIVPIFGLLDILVHVEHGVASDNSLGPLSKSDLAEAALAAVCCVLTELIKGVEVPDLFHYCSIHLLSKGGITGPK